MAGLNDSKQLTVQKRGLLFENILQVALGVGVGVGPVELIDRINIYGATMEAMAGAVYNLPCLPSAVLVDGYPVRGLGLYQQAIIGGDACSLSIAAASVVAKVTRDRLMDRLHRQYPRTGLAAIKGMPPGSTGGAGAVWALSCSPPFISSFCCRETGR